MTKTAHVSKIKKITIPKHLSGKRLDIALSKLTMKSRTHIQKSLILGHIKQYQENDTHDQGLFARHFSLKKQTAAESDQTETGISRDPKYCVHEGEVYIINIPAPEMMELRGEFIDFEILYEDQDLLVLNKPAGLVVHPSPGHAHGTLVHGLLAHCQETLSGIGGVKRPGIVHRLDKPTSGLMIVAKNDSAHLHLSAQLKARTLKRTYWAIVHGVLCPRVGTICAPLGRHPKNRQKQAIVPSGRFAETYYEVQKIFKNKALSVVKCQLKTGRTHQIRVHLASKGHPVLNDTLYGRAHHRALQAGLKDWPTHALGLHATELCFEHPRTEKAMVFQAPPPSYWELLEESTTITQNID
jgi:23S rRNA pseudouridine1911/1915/1917 synthase